MVARKSSPVINGDAVSVSVLTIVRGRQSHLINQMRGLLQSTNLPDEWIVVGMGQEIELPKTDAFPIRTVRLDGDGLRLPLAEARNQAAKLGRNEMLVFLDVDCIPSESMIETFKAALQNDDRLWMGSVRYLQQGAAAAAWSMTDLKRQACCHPLQPVLNPNERRPSSRYELFWSLCFAVSKSTFQTIGGFDESFDGYGGEDTDFAFAARHALVPFGFVDAVAYHQHHEVCKPPMNHFDAIVRNADRFHSKWGVWPMASWLTAFAEKGLVEFDADGDTLNIIRRPSNDEIEAARSTAPAGF